MEHIIRKVKAPKDIKAFIDGINPVLMAKVSARMRMAAKIADAMDAQGVSQKELANRMGKCTSEISEWLSGNRNFTIDTITDISMALGVDLLNLPYEKTRSVAATRVVSSIGKSNSSVKCGGGSVFAAPLVDDNLGFIA